MRGRLHLLCAGAALLAACTPAAEPAVAGAEAEPATLASPHPPAAPPQPALDPHALIGTHWILVEAEGEPVDRAGGGRDVTLEFGNRALGGHSGCNAYGAELRIEGRRFLTSGVESDMQGCAPPVSTIEERLYRALRDPFDFNIDESGRLVILKDGVPALRFRRVPPGPPLAGRPEPAALVGTRWRLVEADGVGVRDDPAYRMATLDFGERTFNGDSGCNHYSASYRVIGRRFVPTPVMATQIGCTGPVGALERRLFQILGSPFEVDADAEGRLVIVGAGGAPVLRLEPR